MGMIYPADAQINLSRKEGSVEVFITNIDGNYGGFPSALYERVEDFHRLSDYVGIINAELCKI